MHNSKFRLIPFKNRVQIADFEDNRGLGILGVCSCHYMVTFRDEEGRNGFHLYDDREEALRMVEHFRNVDEVADLQLYDATAIPIEFRAYYRAEIPNSPVDRVGMNRRAEPVVPEVVEAEAQEATATEAPAIRPG